MQLQQLRHVVALVDHRSLGRAAQILRISQPALSKSLRRLEAHLGVKLFERTARGVMPTEFGREHAQHARSIAVEIHEAERAAGAIRKGCRGPHRDRLGAQRHRPYPADRDGAASGAQSRPHTHGHRQVSNGSIGIGPSA